MDQKPWVWRKKSSEKTIFANGKSGLHLGTNADEIQSFRNEKELALEKSVNILNGQLASIHSECNGKDALLANYERKAHEAIEGKEKVEMELQQLRKSLDEALQQKREANERIGSLNSALRDCMQQLSSSRSEQEQRVCEAVMKKSKEMERANKELEENLSKMNKKVTNLMIENAHLSEVVLVKENVISDLSNRKAQVEAEFAALMSRLDFVEKENAFLRYEHRMLEKDLDIRNEEIELSRHVAESLQKQQFENVKKIKKLEAECQRLRIRMTKRLPGPSAFANVKTELDTQGKYQTRRNLNSVTGGLVLRESRSAREDLDLSNKRISFLVERLQDVEKENKILRDALCYKDSASCDSIIDITQISPIKSQGESQIERLQMALEPVEQSKSYSFLNDISSVGHINNCKENDTNSSRSWASALISELDNFKGGATPNHSKAGIADMNLMDDFVEMEKLAIVAVDVPRRSSHASSDIDHVVQESVTKNLCSTPLVSTGKELVLIGKDDLSGIDHEQPRSNLPCVGYCDWIKNISKQVKEQVQVSQRTVHEILEDIKVALHEACKAIDSPHTVTSQLQPISGYITWKSPEPSPRKILSETVPEMASSPEERKDSQSIHEIIELVRRFGSTNLENGGMGTNRTDRANEDYIIHVFGWKSLDLLAVLEQFVDTCNHQLDGEVDFETFTAELSSALGWILTNCATTNHDPTTGYAQLELSLKLARDESKALSSELQLSHENMKSLQMEMDTLRVSKRMIEDQFENQKLITEDIDTQLNLTKVRLNDFSHKCSYLEVELEDKRHRCQELEGMCLELHLQLESLTSKEILRDNMNQEGKLLQTGWEIKAASAKLAECEATILSLGNQLKSLTPSAQMPFAVQVSNMQKKTSKKLNKRISLLDRILLDDGAREEVPKDSILQEDSQNAASLSSDQLAAAEAYLGLKQKGGKAAMAGALVVIPGKRKRGGFAFLRKLLLTRN